MPKKQHKFADDGWAVWIDGEDVSTIYINDWLNPKGKSYIDLAVRIRGVKQSQNLHVYVPFFVTKEEIKDISLMFDDTNILQATFSASCIVEYMKNQCTSEVAYNGKTVDIVHISALGFEVRALSKGTHIKVDLEKLHPYLDNDEAYFIWRMPHKSLDEIFKSRIDVGKAMNRLKDLITSPVVSEKYGYSIRINESRLLPDEITRIGAFHRQKLKKACVMISIDESYEINDAGCYRIHRLEEDLYRAYLPEDYEIEDVISYQWNQNRDYNLRGHFNFYYNIYKNSISRGSMCLYLVLLLAIGLLGDLISNLIQKLLGM
jgi:hypothetical protein